MAASSGRKTSSSNKKTTLSTIKSAGKPRTAAQKKKVEEQQRVQDSALFHEIGLIVLFAVMALLFCCNFGLIGPAGNTVSGVLFGIFGLTAYVAPVLLFLAAAFWFANEGNPNALRKLIAGIVLFVMLGILCDLFTGQKDTKAGYEAILLYEGCRDNKSGGGILAGSIGFFLRNYLGTIGAVLVVLVCSVVCLILLTEKSLIDSLKQGSNRVRELSREDTERRRENAERRRESIERRREDAEKRREQNRIKRQEQDEERIRKEEARRLREEEIENEKILRMEKKVSGVMLDATLWKPEKILPKDDMHEIILPEEEILEESLQQSRVEIIEEPIVDVEEQVIGEKPMIKEERRSNTVCSTSQKNVPEMSPAFEQWDMPDLPIRIHKEGVEEAEVLPGPDFMPSEESGLQGPGFTTAGDAGMRESGFQMPENIGVYGQSSAIPEDIKLNGPGFKIPEDMGPYELNSTIPDSTGEYSQNVAMTDNAGEYGQSTTMPVSAGEDGQNTAMLDSTGAYEPGATISNSVGVDERNTTIPENTKTSEKKIDEQKDAGPLAQDSLMSDSTRKNFGQNSEAMNSGAGSNAVQNHPMPVSGAASAGGASRPTAVVRLAAEQTGREGNQMQMEGMPSVGGVQSMTSNGKEITVPKQYMFPPITLLQKGVTMTGDSVRELKETAMHLQQTLSTFGVKVTITDISQGPSVTRYELQPEQGVKVSKIVSLTDDIKLNLAAMDIRIEAPIPGKAAIGIEVPNKESIPVALRDLLETEEFRNFPSNLAFAVGKDIAGKVIVADIAKMPHMLIAGATGSGKSVCINTLIMGLLYKAHPDDVKLIMVDPKVVELSVYNGIPHLLIPVVTDPKKASAALHWGVAEMEDRYRKFAELNVRDLKGYNKKAEALQEKGEQNAPKKLPQIVIIVDELADLMMVCPGEVEESICRLAQLARAAGIHLIIATQRPSVDVITGLIKANMPSRVAFSVSSGVDSRTILDMVGAEKLLGKGDMLFYPQGYAKPARVQGAFVSDNEVSDVVDYLKNQMLGNTYAQEIEEKIKNMGSSSGGASGGSEVDELFEKAGRLIIDKDKASIGMLQRALQIGFNRAARIMDQLCSYGVVGEEEGTKPRKILMSPEQFEQLLEEV